MLRCICYWVQCGGARQQPILKTVSTPKSVNGHVVTRKSAVEMFKCKGRCLFISEKPRHPATQTDPSVFSEDSEKAEKPLTTQRIYTMFRNITTPTCWRSACVRSARAEWLSDENVGASTR